MKIINSVHQEWVNLLCCSRSFCCGSSVPQKQHTLLRRFRPPDIAFKKSIIVIPRNLLVRGMIYCKKTEKKPIPRSLWIIVARVITKLTLCKEDGAETFINHAGCKNVPSSHGLFIMSRFVTQTGPLHSRSVTGRFTIMTSMKSVVENTETLSDNRDSKHTD